MSAILGHAHPAIVETVIARSRRSTICSAACCPEPVIGLAEAWKAITPPGLDRVLLLSTGAESNEAALKMARLATGGYEVVGFAQSWHGMTGGAAAATYGAGRRGYGPLSVGGLAIMAPNLYRPSFGALVELRLARRTRLRLRPCRPSVDRGARRLHRRADPELRRHPRPAAGLSFRLKRHCEKRGMMLIVDEAQTGLGRTGEMFAFSATPSFRTSSRCRRLWARACRWRRFSLRRKSRSAAMSAASSSIRPMRPIHCRLLSVWRFWT